MAAHPVLLLTLEYPPDVGGVANYYYRLAREFREKDFTVWCPSLAKPAGGKAGSFTPWWGRGLLLVWRVIRKIQPRYILVGHILPLGTIVWLISFVKHIPYAIFVHGMDITVPQQYARKRKLLMRILRRAHLIITVSRYSEKEIQRLLPESQHGKIRILPPGPSITPALVQKKSALTFARPKRYILSVGRLVERKGFDQTMRALAELPVEYNDIHYVIAGSGSYEAKLRFLADELRVADRVHITTGLTDAQVAQLYAHCLFFMMPSRVVNHQDFEGFGITVIEANSFGKLAIGGNTAGMTDAILDGKTGVLVDPDNVTEIRSAMIQLLTQPDKIRRLGQQAKQWVETEHSWVIKAQQLQKIINQRG